MGHRNLKWFGGFLLISIVLGIPLLISTWGRHRGIKMFAVSVWRDEKGAPYVTLLLTNELDENLEFEWLGSYDRDLSDRYGEELLFSDFDGVPSTLGPHEARTHPARLPPQGTVRRFRLQYHRMDERVSALRRLMIRLVGHDWNSPHRIAISAPIGDGPVRDEPRR